jgi:hypothetical protein
MSNETLRAGVVGRHASLVKLDWYDTEHISPVRLVQQDLAQLGLGRLAREEGVKGLLETLCARAREDLHGRISQVPRFEGAGATNE